MTPPGSQPFVEEGLPQPHPSLGSTQHQWMPGEQSLSSVVWLWIEAYAPAISPTWHGTSRKDTFPDLP